MKISIAVPKPFYEMWERLSKAEKEEIRNRVMFLIRWFVMDEWVEKKHRKKR